VAGLARRPGALSVLARRVARINAAIRSSPQRDSSAKDLLEARVIR
jgi:hypothetical protein